MAASFHVSPSGAADGTPYGCSRVPTCTGIRPSDDGGPPTAVPPDLIRYATILAMLEALDSCMTWWKCRQAFERSGLYPLNPAKLEESDYVIQGSQPAAPAPRRQYFNLNASMLTTRIPEMREYLRQSGKEDTSLEMAPVTNCEEVLTRIIMRNDVAMGKILTPFHRRIQIFQ